MIFYCALEHEALKEKKGCTFFFDIVHESYVNSQKSVAYKQTVWQFLQGTTEEINLLWRWRNKVKAFTNRQWEYQSDAFPSFSQATIQAVPTCEHAPMMAEQSACECHYGNDMKLERKQSGSAQTKNNEGGGSQMHKNATYININIKASD